MIVTFPEDHEYRRGAILLVPLIGPGQGDEISYLNGLLHGKLGHDRYRLTSRHDGIGAYIVKVPEGEEITACEELGALEEVDWANRWDITADRRIAALEEVLGRNNDEIEELRDSAYQSGSAYNERLADLIERLTALLPESS